MSGFEPFQDDLSKRGRYPPMPGLGWMKAVFVKRKVLRRGLAEDVHDRCAHIRRFHFDGKVKGLHPLERNRGVWCSSEFPHLREIRKIGNDDNRRYGTLESTKERSEVALKP